MSLEDIRLNEIVKTQNDRYCLITLIQKISRSAIMSSRKLLFHGSKVSVRDAETDLETDSSSNYLTAECTLCH